MSIASRRRCSVPGCVRTPGTWTLGYLFVLLLAPPAPQVYPRDNYRLREAVRVSPTLVNVRNVHAQRVGEVRDALLATLPLGDAQLGPDPSAFFDRQARSGQWGRLARSADRRRKELKRLVSRQWASTCEKLERASDYKYPAADLTLMQSHVSRSALEAELKRRGKDPSAARYVVGDELTLAPTSALKPVAAVAEKRWQHVLQRDLLVSHALAVAQFNLLATSGTPSAEPGMDVVSCQSLSNTVLTGLRQSLQQRHAAQTAILADDAALAISTTMVDHALPAVAAYAELGDESAAEEAVVAADSLRQLLWLSAVTKEIAWRCLWPNLGRAEDVVFPAAELPHVTEGMQAGVQRLRPSELLAEAPPAGTNLEVLGIVTDVDVKHENRGKAVTTLTLREPGGSDVVVASVPGFKASSTGAVSGCVAAVRGKWRATEDGEAGHIQVGRSRVTGDRDKSMLDYLRWLTAGSYLPVPHGLEIRTSWVTGRDGPLNPVRYGVTARDV